MEIDFNNITPEVIHKITKEDINEFSGEQFIKYKQALDKYKGLSVVTQEKSKAHELINALNKLSDELNEDTRVEIRVKDKYGRDLYIYNQYWQVRYEKGFNTVVISNYNSNLEI